MDRGFRREDGKIPRLISRPVTLFGKWKHLIGFYMYFLFCSTFFLNHFIQPYAVQMLNSSFIEGQHWYRGPVSCPVHLSFIHKST